MYKTVVYSNAEALQAINALYLKGDLHLDTCFRNGAFYKNSGIFPEIKQDLKPSAANVLKIDVTKMEHPRNSVRSIMFDPPWLISGTMRGAPQPIKKTQLGNNVVPGLISVPENLGEDPEHSMPVNRPESGRRKKKVDIRNKLAEKYGGFVSAIDLFSFQDKALFEISRCLIPGGWLITKLQDCSYGRQKYFLSTYQVNKARELGLDLVDSFILIGKNRMRNASAGRLSAISQHCFFMVYRKASRKKRIIRY